MFPISYNFFQTSIVSLIHPVIASFFAVSTCIRNFVRFCKFFLVCRIQRLVSGFVNYFFFSVPLKDWQFHLCIRHYYFFIVASIAEHFFESFLLPAFFGSRFHAVIPMMITTAMAFKCNTISIITFILCVLRFEFVYFYWY